MRRWLLTAALVCALASGGCASKYTGQENGKAEEQSNQAFAERSQNETAAGQTEAGLPEKDRQEEKVLDRIVLKEVLETLEAKDRTIIYLRYFAGKTQAEIGKKMGMSQVQVSRTEKKVLERMRKEMRR